MTGRTTHLTTWRDCAYTVGMTDSIYTADIVDHVTFVGQSWGVRRELRRRLAAHYRIPMSAVTFLECNDWDAESEIRRLNIGWANPGHVNVTFVDLANVDHCES